MRKYTTQGASYLVEKGRSRQICPNRTAAGAAYTLERSRRARLFPDNRIVPDLTPGVRLSMYGTLDDLRPAMYAGVRKMVTRGRCHCCGQIRHVYILSDRGRQRLERLRRKLAERAQ